MRKIIITTGSIVLTICWAFLSAEASAAGITINTGASVTLSLAPSVTTVDVNNSGTLSGGAGTISIKGDWTNTGTFNTGTGTVSVIGAGTSTINGSNTFYNFSCVTASKSITFAANTTQTTSNNLTLTGSGGSPVTLRSSASGTNWKINPQGALSVDYADVQDSNNINVNTIIPSNSVDSGNNSGWRFGSLAFTSAAQTLIINAESNPFTFQINYANNNSANRNITVNLASSSTGTFQFRATSGGSAVTSVTIPAGSASSQFFYIDNTVGTPTLTISSTGYAQAQQQATIVSVGYTLTVTSPQIAGSQFTLTITAIDNDGNTFSAYNGTANLTVNYVTPATGAGVLGVTSTSNFVNGVAAITNQTFSDCGTMTIRATDSANSGITGTSPQVDFRPFDFTVVSTNLDTAATTSAAAVQTVKKPFTLTVTARNAQAGTCPNYTGRAALSVNYISPATNQAGALATGSLDSANWANGIAALESQTYDKWGTITITSTDATLTTQTGTSANIVFIPKNLSVSVSAPPPDRTFYYTNENFSATVTANDFNNSAVGNYQGTVSFGGSGLSLPADYTFTAADGGSHTFSAISGASDTTTSISSSDTSFSSVAGTSGSITIKSATIRVVSTSGPVGPLTVQVQIVDSNGNIITSDNSTQFTIKVIEFIKNGSVVSNATTQKVTVSNGVATIVIDNAEAETITVTAESAPGLTAAAGTVRFGTVSGGGVGVQFWREVGGAGGGEIEEERR